MYLNNFAYYNYKANLWLLNSVWFITMLWVVSLMDHSGRPSEDPIFNSSL